MAPFNFGFWRKRQDSSLPAGRATPSPDGRGREVLVCTRDTNLGSELSSLLSERGYSPSVHRNPWAARYSARRNGPDLAIIDWHLGQQSAAKLSSTLFTSNGTRSCSILALVPQGQPDMLVKILELGVNDFVMLPLDRTLLASRLSLIETRLRELDEIRSLQHKIKQEYQRFLIATGGLGDGVWDLDLATETVHFSDRWKEMLGYTSDEIEENLESWLSRVHPEDLTRLRAIIDASIAGEVTVIEQRYRIQVKNGEYRWMLTRGEVVKDADGKAIRVVGRQTDVDQEDESKEAVRSSGLQDLFQSGDPAFEGIDAGADAGACERGCARVD